MEMQTVQQYVRTCFIWQKTSVSCLEIQQIIFFKDNCYLGNIKNIPEDEGATYENKTYSNMIKNDLSGVESLKPFLHSVNTPTGELQIVDSDAINSFFSK